MSPIHNAASALIHAVLSFPSLIHCRTGMVHCFDIKSSAFWTFSTRIQNKEARFVLSGLSPPQALPLLRLAAGVVSVGMMLSSNLVCCNLLPFRSIGALVCFCALLSQGRACFRAFSWAKKKEKTKRCWDQLSLSLLPPSLLTK